MPHLSEMATRFEDQGLVLIGIHTENAWETMADYVLKNDIPFPVCVDSEGTIAAFGADSYPDYCLIDRHGILRVADLANSGVDDAVATLLAEDDHLSAAVARATEAADDVTFSMFEGEMRTGSFLVTSKLTEVDGERLFETSQSATRIDPDDPDAAPRVDTSTSTFVLGPRLTPLRFTVVDAAGERHSAEVKSDGSTWIVSPTEGDEELEVPAGVLFDSLLFVVVPGLPEVEGLHFEAPTFEMKDLAVSADVDIECMGSGLLDGRKAWRWEVRSSRDGKPGGTMEMWTRDGELLLVEAGPTRMRPE
jgi:hypothetical protein